MTRVAHPLMAGIFAVCALSGAGCVPLAIGGAGAAASSVAQERGVADTFNDFTTEAEIEGKLFRHSAEAFRKVNIKVVEDRVLLTGRVQEPEERIEAARIAWSAKDVREVINEIEVGNGIGFAGNTKDAWISTRLRWRITTDGTINFTNYGFEVLDGTVYVFGLGATQAELDRVVAHIRDVDGVRRVVVHARVAEEGTALADAAGTEP